MTEVLLEDGYDGNRYENMLYETKVAHGLIEKDDKPLFYAGLDFDNGDLVVCQKLPEELGFGDLDISLNRSQTMMMDWFALQCVKSCLTKFNNHMDDFEIIEVMGSLVKR